MSDTNPRDLAEQGWARTSQSNAQSRDGSSPVVSGRSLQSPSDTSEIEIAGLTFSARGTTGDGRTVVSAAGADGVEVHRDIINMNSAVSRKRFVSAMAAKAAMDEQSQVELDSALLRLKSSVDTEDTCTDGMDIGRALEARDAENEARLEAMPDDVVAEAEALLGDPSLIEYVLGHIVGVGVVGEVPLALTLYLQGTSRLLRKPLSIQVQGTSSSGKSHIIDAVASLFPKSAVLKATDMTPNALYYGPFGSLMHVWVIAGERSRIESDERAQATRAVREMISAGELRKALPVKLPDGSFIMQIIYQPGPIAYIESTTNTQVFDEDANRCLQISTDESAEQTDRVITAAGNAAAEPPPDPARIVQVHHAMQLLLRRVQVTVPYAPALAKAMPKARPQARRAFTLMISVIRAIALLHQRQRKAGGVEHGDTIAATIEDYIIARRLIADPLGRALGASVPEAVGRLAQRLQARFGSDTFTSTEALKTEEIINTKGKLNEYLRALSSAGVVELVDEGRGSKPNTWKFVGEIPEPGAAWLPTVRQLEEGSP